MRPIKQDFDIRQRLADQDKSNNVWQRDVALAMGLIGYAKFRAGDYPAALDYRYQASLDLTRKLTETDKTNADLPRDQALLLASIGDAKLDFGPQSRRA